MAYEDKTITCDDCGEGFVHSADDQQRYAERGFEHEPKRCRDCREKRKAKSGGGGGGGGGERRYSGGGGGGGGGGDGAGGGSRESYEATCSECGNKTTVPFKPDPERPVFCRDCYRSRKRA